jgi:hypothetical protein
MPLWHICCLPHVIIRLEVLNIVDIFTPNKPDLFGVPDLQFQTCHKPVPDQDFALITSSEWWPALLILHEFVPPFTGILLRSQSVQLAGQLPPKVGTWERFFMAIPYLVYLHI